MPIASKTVTADLATYVFAPTLPIPVYLVAIAVDRFDVISETTSRGLPVHVYTDASPYPARRAHMRTTARAVASAIDFFEDYFGIPLPLPAMHVAGVAEFVWTGMENFGLIMLSSDACLIPHHYSLSKLIVHEVIHHWAGDLTTPKFWNEVWISEGFAVFFENIYFDAFDRKVGWLAFLTDRELNGVLNQDVLPDTKPIQPESYEQTEELFNYSRQYLNSALVQKMIWNYLGPRDFRAAVSALFREFYLGNVGIDDLVSVYSRYKDCSLLYGWITQPGHPVVILEEDGRIWQAPASLDDQADRLNWIVPLDVSFEKEEEVTSQAIVVGSEPFEFARGMEWVLLNSSAETPCRVWHKGVFHEKLVAAVRQGKVDQRATKRIVEDLEWLVSVGVAPARQLAEFPNAKIPRLATEQVVGGRLKTFAVS
jgi:aminopeptidase N